jgi:hypothetical protein
MNMYTHLHGQVVVVSLALFVYPDPSRFSHCAKWSEGSMEAFLNHGSNSREGGGGGGGGDDDGDGGDKQGNGEAAGPAAVEEGKA